MKHSRSKELWYRSTRLINTSSWFLSGPLTVSICCSPPYTHTDDWERQNYGFEKEIMIIFCKRASEPPAKQEARLTLVSKSIFSRE